ncbi:MAG: hypothetical protein ACFFES_18405, partial [Candidatus Thorarchaeota archaeon]
MWKAILCALAVLAAACALVPAPARAEMLAATEWQITSSSATETNPTLGADAIGDYVVYTTFSYSPTSGLGPGHIVYQRLAADGAPVGAPVDLSDGSTDDQLNDASGSRIVYTAWESGTGQTARVMLHDLETGITTPIADGSAVVVSDVHIDGDVVVWVEGYPGSTTVMYYKVSWMGTGAEPLILAGPGNAPTQVDIGDVIITWAKTMPSGARAISAIMRTDVDAGLPPRLVAADPDWDESRPATMGTWVAWEALGIAEGNAGETQLRAFNLGVVSEYHVVTEPGATVTHPTVFGDRLAYESDVGAGDNFDILLFHLSEGFSQRVTFESHNQFLNNLFGDKVAYVDARNGNYEVWVSHLEPVGSVLAQQKISDTEGGFDGVLDSADWFGASVAALGDLDGDGVSDLAVGSPGDDDGGSGPYADRGAVYVLFLNPDGSVKGHQKISATEGGFSGLLDLDFFGVSAAALGDLDGDGVGDLAVGIDPTTGPIPSAGAVWILFLDADGTVKASQKVGAGEGGFAGTLEDDDHFGASAAALGDLDGDGVGDLAIGSPRDDDGGSGPDADRGAVWVLFLNPDGSVKSHQKISDTEGDFG